MRQPPQHISAPLKHLFQTLALAICFALISVRTPAFVCYYMLPIVMHYNR